VVKEAWKVKEPQKEKVIQQKAEQCQAGVEKQMLTMDGERK
jgi:hypothetical protein